MFVCVSSASVCLSLVIDYAFLCVFFQQVFELQHNGVCSEAEEVAWYETGERAIMNCVAFTADSTVEGGGRIDEGDHVLAAGLDDDLQVYFIRRQVVPEHADGHVLADEGQLSISLSLCISPSIPHTHIVKQILTNYFKKE